MLGIEVNCIVFVYTILWRQMSKAIQILYERPLLYQSESVLLQNNNMYEEQFPHLLIQYLTYVCHQFLQYFILYQL